MEEGYRNRVVTNEVRNDPRRDLRTPDGVFGETLVTNTDGDPPDSHLNGPGGVVRNGRDGVFVSRLVTLKVSGKVGGPVGVRRGSIVSSSHLG